MDFTRDLFNHHRPGSSWCRPWRNNRWRHRRYLCAGCRYIVHNQPLTSISLWSTVLHQGAVFHIRTLSHFCYALDIKRDQKVKNVSGKSGRPILRLFKVLTVQCLLSFCGQLIVSIALMRQPFYGHIVHRYRSPDYCAIPVLATTHSISLFNGSLVVEVRGRLCSQYRYPK